MKNSKGQELQQSYLDLALMRREQKPYQAFSDMLLNAFDWSLTNEGRFFWSQVFYECKTPEIPESSLAELEAWRKENGMSNIVMTEFDPKINENPYAQSDEPDWKAKYDDLEYEYHKLKFDFEIAVTEAEESAADLRDLQTKYDELKSGDTSRNWVAECAMAAMQGMLSYYSGGNGTRPTDEIISEKSWKLAEAWAADGKKRGHI